MSQYINDNHNNMSWALGIIQQERRGRMISSGCVVKEINCFDFLGLNEASGGCCKVPFYHFTIYH